MFLKDAVYLLTTFRGRQARVSYPQDFHRARCLLLQRSTIGSGMVYFPIAKNHSP